MHSVVHSQWQRSATQLTALFEKLNDAQIIWLHFKGEILCSEIFNERLGTVANFLYLLLGRVGRRAHGLPDSV